MIPLLKAVLGCVGAIGGVCAVAIPVAFSAGGGGQSESAKSIKKCEANTQDGWEQIDFGGEKKLEICWTIDPQNPPSNENSITEEQKQNYSGFFKATWDIKEGTWNHVKLKEINEQDWEFWTSWCEYSQHKGWAAPDRNTTSDGKYYLGVCKKGEESSKTWVEVDGKAKEKLIFKVCQNSCWSDEQDSGTASQVKSLKQPSSTNWYTVSFKKKKIQPTAK